MATPAIKTSFKLDGEQEYKAAISEINSSLRVLNSEMKLTSVQFDGASGSVEALTATSDVLNRQILTQQEKIQTLRAALQSSAQEYGEADERTKRWQVSLNKAEAELLKMEGALDKNQKALDAAAQGTDDLADKTDAAATRGRGLGDMADQLAGKLGIDLPDNIKASLDGLAQLDTSAALAIGGFAGIVAIIAEVEQALIGLTQEQAANAGAVQDTAMQYDMSTDAVQRYQYACEIVGTSFDTVASSQSRMIRSMDDARNGSATAQASWQALGVAIVDANGNLRDAETVFFEVIDALGNVENATERDALAMDVFGRSARDLNPLIVQGTGYFRELCAEAGELGRVLTDVELEALAQVDDALIRHNASVEAGEKAIALKFAPALQAFYDAAGEGIREIDTALADSGIVTIFGSLLEIVTALAPAFDVLGQILTTLQPVFGLVAVVIGGIADMLTLIFSVLSGIAKLLSFQLPVDEWNTIKGLFTGNSATDRALASLTNASGDQNFPGGFTWVGENGPERIYLPAGSRIDSHQESMRAGGGDVYHITIDARSVQEFEDIVRIAQNQRRIARMRPGTAGE